MDLMNRLYTNSSIESSNRTAEPATSKDFFEAGRRRAIGDTDSPTSETNTGIRLTHSLVDRALWKQFLIVSSDSYTAIFAR
jgi:hypothetical protein